MLSERVMWTDPSQEDDDVEAWLSPWTLRLLCGRIGGEGEEGVGGPTQEAGWWSEEEEGSDHHDPPAEGKLKPTPASEG